MDKSIKFLEQLQIGQKCIILGCSGGPDSMCLLDLLCRHNYRIICAHVNHNIRKESADEYLFMKQYCEERGIIFEGLELEKKQKQSESYYREKRYTFYKELAQKYDTPYIMTAHHGDDLMETILMRLTRGSYLKGYAGFTKCYREKEFIFAKPLIFYTKEEIEEYVKENEIPFFLDATNLQDDYTRNRFRHRMLPFLKEENREAHLKFLKYSEEIEEASNFIESQVVKACIRCLKEPNQIDLTLFRKEENYMQKKIVEHLLKKVYGDAVDNLKVFHIESIRENIQKDKNFSLDLPLGYKALREYDILKIERPTATKKYHIKLEPITILPNGETIEIVDDEDDTSNYTTRLNSEDLELPLHVRTRKSTDRMAIKNMYGTKKISDIFIDEKVSPSQREDYPILVDSQDRIIWLPGLRKSKFNNEKGQKYDIILKYTKKGKF